MSNTILDVKNLHITFEQPKVSKQILEDVSFSVKAGKCLGILGESGSGKSMTTKGRWGPSHITRFCNWHDSTKPYDLL